MNYSLGNSLFDDVIVFGSYTKAHSISLNTYNFKTNGSVALQLTIELFNEDIQTLLPLVLKPKLKSILLTSNPPFSTTTTSETLLITTTTQNTWQPTIMTTLTINNNSTTTSASPSSHYTYHSSMIEETLSASPTSSGIFSNTNSLLSVVAPIAVVVLITLVITVVMVVFILKCKCKRRKSRSLQQTISIENTTKMNDDNTLPPTPGQPPQLVLVNPHRSRKQMYRSVPLHDIALPTNDEEQEDNEDDQGSSNDEKNEEETSFNVDRTDSIGSGGSDHSDSNDDDTTSYESIAAS